MLHRGELPAKVDKDPEWRTSATFTTREVEQLISDPRIPVERRVQYALKAIAGLRHGEVAGLSWRHYDPTLEPLGRLVIATSYDTGRTKTEVTRRFTHTTKGDVVWGYTRAQWPALCAEVAKLRVSTLDGEVLLLATVFATAGLRAKNRW